MRKDKAQEGYAIIVDLAEYGKMRYNALTRSISDSIFLQKSMYAGAGLTAFFAGMSAAFGEYIFPAGCAAFAASFIALGAQSGRDAERDIEKLEGLEEKL